MTWLFLHFHWAFPALQAFTGQTSSVQTVRLAGNGEEPTQTLRGGPLTAPQGRWLRHRDYAQSPTVQHLPAPSLFPASGHLLLGQLRWQYAVPCFIRIWHQLHVHLKIWDMRGQPRQSGSARRTSWHSSSCPTKPHKQKLPRSESHQPGPKEPQEVL